MTVIAFRILGEAASKSNSRDFVDIPIKGHPGKKRRISKKSDKALAFALNAQRQIPPWARQMVQGEVFLTLRMYYTSEISDMDESLVLDVLQAQYERVFNPATGKKEKVLTYRGVYVNDRQVRKRHVEHFIDKDNPRVEIEVRPRYENQMQQQELT